MKVFVSWSGDFSRECAELISDWIKCTLQASEPWISTKDIDKGSLWFNEISDELKDTKVGIVCLTKDNKDKPWILFEAGALAKGLSTNRVCTILINLKPSDLGSPLSQFNHTIPDKEGMKGLLVTINKELGDHRLDDRILDQVFDTYWDSFNMKIKAIMDSEPTGVSSVPTRSKDQMLEEILYTTRAMDRRVRHLERTHEDESLVRRRIPRREAEARIEELAQLGASKDEIMDKLVGLAPSNFIKMYSNKVWEKLRMEKSEQDKCEEQ